MISAFLSHSSSDKTAYVRVVAEKLGPVRCVYDEYTFEAGMKTIDEIMKGLNDSQLFVAFLSNHALSSSWVTQELFLAQEKLNNSQLERVYPIIIDPDLRHDDPRIPSWLRDSYNLKYVSRPTVSARRIRQRLRELSWLKHPGKFHRGEIFVGRNDLITVVEERVDDFNLEVPTCFIASGFPRIGRSSLLQRALIKCNIVTNSYEFPSIMLRRDDGLEDFILKVYDLGFSDIPFPTDLMEMSIDDRKKIAEKLLLDLQGAREILLVHDENCILDYRCELKLWFDDLMRVIARSKPTVLLASKYRPRFDHLRSRPHIFFIYVPELSHNERSGLFRRIIDAEGLSISQEDATFFSGLLQGFPDQVRYSCELIRELGVSGARKKSHQIIEFNSDRAVIILNKYTDPKEMNFLYLLSRFDFISFEFLFSIVSESDYKDLLNELVESCICDYVGLEKEFIRLNDTVRDHILRTRLDIPEEFQTKLDEHLNEFISSKDEENRDISDVLYSIKEGIKSGRRVPSQYLIPSHFLRSMRELYQQKGRLDLVIKLADQVLEKEHLLDPTVAEDIRYFLCLSLAKKRDVRMLQEVQKIHGPEHKFLLGFYYRLQGRSSDAIDALSQCIDSQVVASRAKRELVQVLLSIEDYEKAQALAKQNYLENKNNEYHIQAYFSTLINSSRAVAERDQLKQLITDLQSVHSEVAKEMADIANAEYYAKCEKNYKRARDIISDVVATYRDSPYPLISMGFMASKNNDVNTLREACEKLNDMSLERSVTLSSIYRLRAILYALDGDLTSAITYADTNLRKLPENARLAFIERLREHHINRSKGIS